MTVHEGALLGGRYRLEKLIGNGGTADVYRAFDEERQAPVAVKVLHPHLAADPDFVRRFRGEAEALEVLDHPSIVRLYAFEEAGAEVFLVLDYVAGMTLGDRLAARRGPFDLRDASRILHDLCGALHYAHRKGIVHQDLKPGNVILKPDGRAMLTDFGIARALGSAGAPNVTMGTPPYMSPEQIRGEGADAQSDIYSLGVVLYEMVAGRRPFTGGEVGLTEANTTDRLHEAHLWFSAPDPRTYNPKLPAEASAVILRALAKRARDRWPDVLSFRQAWDVALGGQVGVHDDGDAVPIAPGDAGRPPPERQRGRVWVWLLGLGLVVALAAVGFVAVTLLNSGALDAREAAVASPTATPLPPAPTSISATPTTPSLQATSNHVLTTRRPAIQTASPQLASSTGAFEAAVPATATTAVQVREPTLMPTFTVQPSITPPTQRPARTVQTSPTPRTATAGSAKASTSASSGVTLTSPPAGATLQGRVTFEWRNTGGFALGQGEQYELVFWQPGQDGLAAGRSPVGASDRPTATVEVSGAGQLLGLPSGQLMWGVRLWGPSGAVRMLSEGRPFTYEQEGGGNAPPPSPPKPDE